MLEGGFADELIQQAVVSLTKHLSKNPVGVSIRAHPVSCIALSDILQESMTKSLEDGTLDVGVMFGQLAVAKTCEV